MVVWFALANMAAIGALAIVVVALWLREPGMQAEATPATVAQAPAVGDRTAARSAAARAAASAAGHPALDEPAQASSVVVEATGADSTGAAASVSPPASEDSGSDAPGHLSAGEVLDRVDGGIVLITALDEDGQQIGFGSGFLIDESGLVATNYHVIDRASQAVAQFRDGQKLDVTGYRAVDPQGDLAILQLASPPVGAEVLPLSASGGPAQGEDVVAIGHPQGFRFSMSSGVVSAVHLSREIPEEYRQAITAAPESTWIQTTAAVSGGNSGGPLIDGRGEVIGINTWVAEGENLAFAAHVRHLADLRGQLAETATPLANLSQVDREVDAIVAELINKSQWFEMRLQQAEDEAEREELRQTGDPYLVYGGKLLELAEAHPGTSGAFRALTQALSLVVDHESDEADELLRRIGARLVADHVGHASMGQVVLALRTSPHASAIELLEQVEAADTSRDVKALACYSRGVCLLQRAEAGEGNVDDAVAALDRVEAEYADIHVGNTRLGAVAAEEAFTAKYLSIGREAPEIVGQDLDGVEFKLSDYRGRVVVLDFWADWCPHCVRMYPVERKLVETYQGRPFDIVGVNGDDPNRLRQVLERKTVTWRSFVDGQFGPIAQQYHIQGIPALFVLDHNGVIRFKDVRGEELEAAVAELMGKLPGAEPVGIEREDIEKPAADKERPAAAPDEAAAAIRAVGGTIEAYRFQGRPALKIVMQGREFDDAVLENVRSLPDTRELFLGRSSVSDAGLARLIGLERLEVLGLDDTRLTDAGMAHLAQVPSLKIINVGWSTGRAAITDAGAEHLARLTQLTSLGLGNTQLTDQGLQHLAGLEKLEAVILTGVAVSDEALAELQRKLPRLTISR